MRVERGDASAGRASPRARDAGVATRANEGTNGLSALFSRRVSRAVAAAAFVDASWCTSVRIVADEVGARAESGDGASLRAAIVAAADGAGVPLVDACSNPTCAAPGAAADGAACGCGWSGGDAGSFAFGAVDGGAASSAFLRDAVLVRGAARVSMESPVAAVRLRGVFGVASEVAALPAALARLRGAGFGASLAAVVADARLRGALGVVEVGSVSPLADRVRARGAGASSPVRAVRLRGAGVFSSSMRESVAGPARRNPAMLDASCSLLQESPMNGLPSRYFAFLACLVVLVLCVLGWHEGLGVRLLAIVAGLLVVVGIVDLAQTRSTLRRNYPITSHIRFFFEYFRPMLRQYVVESDNEEVPFSHVQRAVVKQRSKNALDVRPFGSELDMYAERYEWLNHSIAPSVIADPDFRIDVGGAQCAKPYSASVFNISAMSFGALSPNAIRALNGGAKQGGFYHDTGEGSLSSYHRENGGDIVWELGSGYFGAASAPAYSARRNSPRRPCSTRSR